MRITYTVLYALFFLLNNCVLVSAYDEALTDSSNTAVALPPSNEQLVTNVPGTSDDGVYTEGESSALPNEREELKKTSYEDSGAYPDATKQYEILLSCPLMKIYPQVQGTLKEPLKATLENIELYPKGTEQYKVHLQNHLLLAAASGNIRVLEVLLDLGVAIDSLNRCGKTALMVAAEKGQLAAAEWLLKHNADVTKRTMLKEDALSVAAGSGRIKMAKLLLDSGAEINVKDKDDFSALDTAISARRPAMVNFLLSQGAKITDDVIERVSSGELSKDSSENAKEIVKIITCHQKGLYYANDSCHYYPLEKTLKIAGALGTLFGIASAPFILLSLAKENPRHAAQFLMYATIIAALLSIKQLYRPIRFS